MTSQRRRAVAADCNTTVDATPTAPELIAALSYDDVSVAASQSLRLEHRSTKVLIARSVRRAACTGNVSVTYALWLPEAECGDNLRYNMRLTAIVSHESPL
jgi:hypothetical protein